MASTLDPDSFSVNGKPVAKGHDIRTLGPSDSSDSGSDIAGDAAEDEGAPPEADSDRFGTGERAAATTGPDVEVNGDIAPDRIVTAEEAGLGGGLDQAEEAQLGIVDEEPDADTSPDELRPKRREPGR
jgi:hypothetical protein